MGMTDEQIGVVLPQQVTVPTAPVQGVGGLSDEAIGLAPPQQQPDRSTMDKLLGVGGERFQTFPERIVRGIPGFASDVAESVASGVTLPGDVMKGEAQVPFSPNLPGGGSNKDAGRLADLMALALPVSAASRGKMVLGDAQVPTFKELSKEAKRGYRAFRDSDLVVDPAAVRTLGAEIEAGLAEKGIIGELAPKTHAILKKIRNPPKGSIATAANLEAIRRSLGKAARDFINPTEQEAARQAIKAMDEFAAAFPKGSVLAGDARAAEAASKAARGNFAAAKRSQKITTTVRKAERRAASANSGRNIGNSIRGKMASLAEKPKEVSGFTRSERASLEAIADGTRAANSSRFVGNALGGGGGLGMLLTSGAGAGAGSLSAGPAGAVIGAGLPFLGMAAKGISNKLTKKAVRKLDIELRKRSPLYERRLSNPPLVERSAEARAAIIRAVLLGQ